MEKKKQKSVKMMPHNNEAEQSILGALLIDSNAGISVFATVKDDDFYMEVHKIIFNAMYNVYNANKPVDYVTVTAELDNSGDLDAVGGYDYIMKLTDIVPSAENLQYYLEILTKFAPDCHNLDPICLN